MVRKKSDKLFTLKTYRIEEENSKWLARVCERENLSRSQVMNKAILRMRKSGVVW